MNSHENIGVDVYKRKEDLTAAEVWQRLPESHREKLTAQAVEYLKSKNDDFTIGEEVLEKLQSLVSKYHKKHGHELEFGVEELLRAAIESYLGDEAYEESQQRKLVESCHEWLQQHGYENTYALSAHEELVRRGVYLIKSKGEENLHDALKEEGLPEEVTDEELDKIVEEAWRQAYPTPEESPT